MCILDKYKRGDARWDIITLDLEEMREGLRERGASVETTRSMELTGMRDAPKDSHAKTMPVGQNLG